MSTRKAEDRASLPHASGRSRNLWMGLLGWEGHGYDTGVGNPKQNADPVGIPKLRSKLRKASPPKTLDDDKPFSRSWGSYFDKASLKSGDTVNVPQRPQGKGSHNQLSSGHSSLPRNLAGPWVLRSSSGSLLFRLKSHYDSVYFRKDLWFPLLISQEQTFVCIE